MRHLRPLAAVAISAALVTAPGTATAAPAFGGPPATAAAVAPTRPDPADIRAAARRLMPQTDPALKQQLDRALGGPSAIDPGQYQCGPTELNRWVAASTADWGSEDLATLNALGALNLPTYDALLFGSENSADHALRADAQTLTKTMRKLEKFWDIKSDDIQLMAMHGDMLRDTARTARVYEAVYGLSPSRAEQMARLLADFVASRPYFEGGNHPLFTFNAFAYSSEAEDVPSFGAIGDRIVVGDGMLQAFREMGYGDVAPQAVLAHEFGHHIQFELAMHGGVSNPEATRRTELHADAAAAYFLSHPRGMSMQLKRVTQFLRVFSSIGDCQFGSPGHHGTPNQREAAANWAYRLQETARPKGKVLPSTEFTRLFDAALPGIVAPDAGA